MSIALNFVYHLSKPVQVAWLLHFRGPAARLGLQVNPLRLAFRSALLVFASSALLGLCRV